MQSQSQEAELMEEPQVLIRPVANMSIFDDRPPTAGSIVPTAQTLPAQPEAEQMVLGGSKIEMSEMMFLEMMQSIERMAMRSQPRHDPIALGLVGVGFLGLLLCLAIVTMRALNQSPTAQSQAQMEQVERMAARSQKLAEEAIKKPRCSFTLVCPSN